MSTPIYFVSDVQINALSDYPDNIASVISNKIGSNVVYDAGDLVEHGNYPLNLEVQEYNRYKELFPHSIPVPGNHDHYDGLSGWTWDRWVDVYDQGIHIVGFDTDYYRDATQRALLESKLTDDPNVMTILFMHHQIYSDNLRNGEVSVMMRKYLLPIIEKTKVDLVICGHGHAYERHYDGSRTYLVVGGGGAPLDEVGTSDTLIKAASEHHWIEVLPKSTGIAVLAKRLDGSILDYFKIEKKFIEETPTSFDRLKF